MHFRALNWQLSTLVLALLFSALFYGQLEAPISLGEGHPYDADYYMRMAEQVAAGEPLRAQKPFVYRVGMPYLAGTLSPEDPLHGFRWIGLGAGLLTLWLSHSLLCRLLSSQLSAHLLTLLLAVSPLGPLRQPHFYPATPELPALCVTLCMLRLCLGRRALDARCSLVLAALSFLGVLFRESAVLAPLAIFLAYGLVREPASADWRRLLPRLASAKPLALALAPLGGAALGLLCTHAWVEALGTHPLLESPGRWISHHMANPSIYPLAWLCAFGPLFLLALGGLLRGGARRLSHHKVLLYYSLGVALLAVIGGSHTDRFVFWAFPVVLWMAGHFIEQQLRRGERPLARLRWALPLLMAQALAFRVLHPWPDDTRDSLLDPDMPQWIGFSPYGEGVNTAQMFAAYMSSEQRLGLLLQYLLLLLYLLVLLTPQMREVWLGPRARRPHRTESWSPVREHQATRSLHGKAAHPGRWLPLHVETPQRPSRGQAPRKATSSAPGSPYDRPATPP